MKISEHPMREVHTHLIRNGLHLGTLMIEEGLITDSQLREALKTQSDLGAYKPVGQILVDQKAISAKQLNLCIDKYHKRARLGEVLLKSRIITGVQLEIALSYQKTTGLPLGEMLIKLNYINEETMRQSLCTHLNIPFIDLDKFMVDPVLRKLINKNYAKNNRIIPIANLGNTITLAMEDPTNTAIVKELRTLSGITINVVTSTSAKIHRAFAKLYGEELVALAGYSPEVLQLGGRLAYDSPSIPGSLPAGLVVDLTKFHAALAKIPRQSQQPAVDALTTLIESLYPVQEEHVTGRKRKPHA
jgi:hypothetical protein